MSRYIIRHGASDDGYTVELESGSTCQDAWRQFREEHPDLCRESGEYITHRPPSGDAWGVVGDQFFIAKVQKDWQQGDIYMLLDGDSPMTGYATQEAAESAAADNELEDVLSGTYRPGRYSIKHGDQVARYNY